MFKVGQKVKIIDHGRYTGFTGELSGVVIEVAPHGCCVSNYPYETEYLCNNPSENLFHLFFLNEELRVIH